jgi:hypothetical protein
MADIDIGAVVRRYIEDTPQLSELAGRVFPDAAPQNVSPPFATYAITSDEHAHTLTGLGGMTQTNIQIDTVTNRRQDSGRLARDIVRALVGLRGAQYGVWVDSLFVIDGPRSFELQPTGGQEVYRYVSTVNFGVFFVEATTLA